MLSVRSAVLLVAVLVSILALSAGQTNLITNGNFEAGSFSGWTTPLGVNDTGIGASNRLRVFSDGTAAAPNGWAYDGVYSALWESSSLNQSLVQTVTVTGNTQYLLSFFVNFADGDTTAYLRVSAQFNDGSSPIVLLTPTGGEGAQQSFCQGSQGAQPPFWWSQFKFTVTAPSSATSMTLTFYGYDSEYGFMVDTITMYPASGNSQPSAPPALPVVPATNLLINGNFETGSLQPWQSTMGDNPYGLFTNSPYSGEGAYDFVGFAPKSGIPCQEGNYCFTFGAALAPLPIQQTIAVPSGTSASYSLSFYWYSLGGYNVSNPQDAGSQLVVLTGWSNGNSAASSLTPVFQEYNTTAVTSATSYNTVNINLGVPPSGTQALTLQMQGYFYATYYVVDYVLLTASGVTQAQSAPVYTCVGKGTSTGAAAQLFNSGALKTVAALVSAVVVLLML